MQTVHGWVSTEYGKLGLGRPTLPIDSDQRLNTRAEALDAVFVLGKGFLYFDNVPTGFIDSPTRTANPALKWVFSDTASGNLLLLFTMLQGAMANMEAKWLNPLPYLSEFAVARIQWGA
jgi:hypothetical protein